MEYTALHGMEYYGECGPVVAALGYRLVELKVIRHRGTIQVSVVITGKAPEPPGNGAPTSGAPHGEPPGNKAPLSEPSGNAAAGIGVSDCARVHRVLLPRLEALLGSDDVAMEVGSPGTERVIKNAAEFALFVGRPLRVWDRTITEWRSGILAAAEAGCLRLRPTNTAGTADVSVDVVTDVTAEVTVRYEDIAKAKLF
jgi:ribosome maturation factor RimP